MKKEHIVEARNHAYELMLTAQSMMAYAETKRDMKIAAYLYHAAFGGYWMMVEIEKSGAYMREVKVDG